ncbi:MAG: maleylpyruvate isomerase N-terminal domain-containing protein [Acidimicrobiia bacterium]
MLATPATRLTACRGWTAHELVAHLAAGAAEEADIIEAHLVGVPRPTRGFEERESPYRAMPDAHLRDRLVEEAARLTVALGRLRHRERERVIFTGRPMSEADFAMHSRSECTLHRWDLVGRDDVGWRMLAQPCLTKHALEVLTSMSELGETAANRLARLCAERDVRLIIRSAPHDDVVATVSDSALTLVLKPIDDTAADVELDAAARLLMLWGRREPSAPVDVHAAGPAAEALEAMFGW